MPCYLEYRWGKVVENPTIEAMEHALRELDKADEEHPDAWLSAESGWTASAHESGLMVWENPESELEPRHMPDVSREVMLDIWVYLSQGNLEAIEAFPWESGCGPKAPEDELLELKREAEKVTLEAARKFYDELGPEREEVRCRKEGCERGAVPLSVHCRPHHYENLYKKPCPFSH